MLVLMDCDCCVGRRNYQVTTPTYAQTEIARDAAAVETKPQLLWLLGGMQQHRVRFDESVEWEEEERKAERGHALRKERRRKRLDRKEQQKQGRRRLRSFLTTLSKSAATPGNTVRSDLQELLPIAILLWNRKCSRKALSKQSLLEEDVDDDELSRSRCSSDDDPPIHDAPMSEEEDDISTAVDMFIRECLVQPAAVDLRHADTAACIRCIMGWLTMLGKYSVHEEPNRVDGDGGDDDPATAEGEEEEETKATVTQE